MKYLGIPFWLGALSSVIGCAGAADIPSTPDLSVLTASYDQPSAMLDPQGALDALANAPSLEAIVAGFRSTNYVLTGIAAANDTSAKHVGGRIRLQGAIHANIRCPGGADDPVFDAATNGTVALTIALADNSIRRDIGGVATKCSLKGTLLGSPVPVVVDGPLAIDLGSDLSLGNRWSGRLLVSLQGELRVADRFSFHNLSARFDDSQLEHLIQLPNGSTVVIAVADDGIRVHGRNGTWVCTQAQSCIPE